MKQLFFPVNRWMYLAKNWEPLIASEPGNYRILSYVQYSIELVHDTSKIYNRLYLTQGQKIKIGMIYINPHIVDVVKFKIEYTNNKNQHKEAVFHLPYNQIKGLYLTELKPDLEIEDKPTTETTTLLHDRFKRLGKNNANQS